MVVKFGADLSGLNGGVAQAKVTLGDFGNIVGTGLMAAGTAVVGFGAASMKMAGDFQSSITSLVTGAGETQANLKLVSDGILKMAGDTGTSTKQLIDGMYMIESAGYHGADGLKVLQTAAEGAKVGNADLGTVSNALTTILTDYHQPASQATADMNALVTTVASGKTHMQDLSSALGAVLPLASSLHISFPQVAGAIAVMTNSGMSAQNAAQNLANTIRSLAAPNAAAVKSMKAVGLSAQDLHDTLSNQGLAAAIQLVEEHVGHKFPAGSVEAVQAFKKIMGGATGYNVALMVGGQNMQAYENNIKNIGNAMKSGGDSVQGWSLVQQNFNQQAAQAQEKLNALMITVGSALLPQLAKLMANVTPLIASFTDWIQKNDVVNKSITVVTVAFTDFGTAISITIQVIGAIIKAIQAIYNWFVVFGPGIGVVAGIITAFFLPALIQIGIEATVAGAKLVANFIAAMFQSGVAAVVNAAKITGSFIASVIQAGLEGWASMGKIGAFIGSMVASGAAAVANGAKITGSFIASMVTSGATAVAQAAKVTVSFIASMIKAGVQAVIAGAQVVGSFVAAMITTAAQAIVTGVTFTASLIPAIIAFTASALTAAATAIPAILAGFVAWAIGAWTVAAANIAAFWPIYLAVAAIIVIIALVVLAVKNWGAISTWLMNTWQSVRTWFAGFWADVQAKFQYAINYIGSIIKEGGIIFYNDFIKPFADAWTYVSGILGKIGDLIHNILGGAANIGGTIAGGLHNMGIPGFASGVQNFSGGLAVVGENGPELVHLPRGSSVYPSGTGPSISSASSGGGDQHIYVMLDSTVLAQAIGKKQQQLIYLHTGAA